MSSFLSGLKSESLSFLEGILQSTLHIEGSLGVVVSLALQKSSETVNSVLQLNQFTLSACEDLAHEERLGKEFLDLSGSGHSQFVIL